MTHFFKNGGCWSCSSPSISHPWENFSLSLWLYNEETTEERGKVWKSDVACPRSPRKGMVGYNIDLSACALWLPADNHWDLFSLIPTFPIFHAFVQCRNEGRNRKRGSKGWLGPFQQQPTFMTNDITYQSTYHHEDSQMRAGDPKLFPTWAATVGTELWPWHIREQRIGNSDKGLWNSSFWRIVTIKRRRQLRHIPFPSLSADCLQKGPFILQATPSPK